LKEGLGVTASMALVAKALLTMTRELRGARNVLLAKLDSPLENMPALTQKGRDM
jgi:hypothetical protein